MVHPIKSARLMMLLATLHGELLNRPQLPLFRSGVTVPVTAGFGMKTRWTLINGLVQGKI
jgi:hypothetical protein